jgi:hypothetical protein
LPGHAPHVSNESGLELLNDDVENLFFESIGAELADNVAKSLSNRARLLIIKYPRLLYPFRNNYKRDCVLSIPLYMETSTYYRIEAHIAADQRS